jgi:hypothetical protein
MTYKVCILTAGTGSRLGELTRYLNKSLISVANKPVISHIIEKFPKSTEFVIALGYKGNLVREFLELAYSDRKFIFSEVHPYEGPGSGLGLSLLACKEFLQEPFIFISCDTLVNENIPPPDNNWMGYSNAEDLGFYRTIELNGNIVKVINEKGMSCNALRKPYIGLAGIYDFTKFWNAMESDEASITKGESHGLKALLGSINAVAFSWNDTGNLKSLREAKEYFKKPNDPNILEKTNETIWFVGTDVIKFSDDEKFIKNRVERAKNLSGYVPEITGCSRFMYRYKKHDGKIFSEISNIPLFINLLEYAKGFWKRRHLSEADMIAFRADSLNFYRNKTYERIQLFYNNFSCSDCLQLINGVSVPPLRDLLDSVDWESLANGIPVKFHGDFHFENILWDQSKKSFYFLDWRQDFSGNMTSGDIYYDFAKLLHGLIVNHEIIKKDLYHVEWKDGEVNFDFHRKYVSLEYEKYFTNWLRNEKYSVKKVRIITALVYLNIATLHHHPYSLLLYSLGKSMLHSELNEKNETA